MAARQNAKPKIQGRILLVDDNKSGLMARCAVLQELGCTTTATVHPRQALTLFSEAAADGSSYQMVITDYKMPEINGVDFIEKIRSVDPHIPVVLISGFVDALGLTEKSTGADVVIMKSANEVQHLIRAANRLLTPSRKKPPRSATATPRAKHSVATGS